MISKQENGNNFPPNLGVTSVNPEPTSLDFAPPSCFFPQALQQVVRRTISSTARRQVENKVKQKQKLFQVKQHYVALSDTMTFPRIPVV